jgi:hypothetical protein
MLNGGLHLALCASYGDDVFLHQVRRIDRYIAKISTFTRCEAGMSR